MPVAPLPWPTSCFLDAGHGGFGSVRAQTMPMQPHHIWRQDEATGALAKRTRFCKTTNWRAADIAELDALKVGAGRFSGPILQKTRANLWSVDYSSVMEADSVNNGRIATAFFPFPSKHLRNAVSGQQLRQSTLHGSTPAHAQLRGFGG